MASSNPIVVAARSLGRVPIWTWAVLVFSMGVCGTISWLHFEQRATIARTEQVLNDVREARIDLAKGFIYLLLSGDAQSPFSRQEGRALLEQATSVLQRVEERKLAERSGRPEEAGIGAEFREKTAEFQAQLAAWEGTEGSARRETELRLRITFHELERLADRIDIQSQSEMRALVSRLDQRFVLILAGAVVLLSGICIADYIAGRNQRLAYQALRESEERLRLVGDNLPDSYVYQYVREPSGRLRFTYVSAGFDRVHGAPGAEIVRGAGSFHALIEPEQQPALAAAESASAANLTDYEIEVWIRRPDGNRRLLHLKSRPSWNAEWQMEWNGFATDMTERKREQEEIKATNERYARQESALTTLTRVCALGQTNIKDLMGEVTQVAANTLEVERASVWRYDPGRRGIICRKLFDRSTRKHSSGTVLQASDFPAYFRAMMEGDIIVANDAHGDPRTSEFSETYLRPLGISSMLDAPVLMSGSVAGVLCFEHVGAARRWTADEQTFAIAVANVVSLLLADEERQQMEEQLRQSQKMEAIGQLAGGVAHDFNNILAGIMIQTELSAMTGDVPEDVQDGLKDIRAAAERAAGLTRQLLVFGRRQVMQPRDLDLNEVVASHAKMLQRIIGEDVYLQLELHPAPVMTQADSGMLNQVLLNFCVNARDAMPEGGPIVLKTCEQIVDAEKSLQHADATPGRFACLSIRDTGTGIAPDVLPRIFEPFFTTKEAGKGTGLGLATVFGIVKQHRGWIEVDSEMGKGTSFHVFLPATEVMREEQAETVEPPKPRGGTEAILVVEDDKSLRMLIKMVLRRHGYHVLEAADGVEALEVWEEHGAQVELLLTDLVMPEGLNGLALARRLKASKPNLKVVFTSGYSAEIAGREMQLSPGENYLQKPCTAAEILESVRRCLDDHEVHPVDGRLDPNRLAGKP